MSLTKQLWFAILITVLMATLGSFGFSVFNSKQALEHQMQTKNIDNANALALSISQMDKDPTTIELLMAAQFDSGHYHFIKLEDPNDQMINEVRNEETTSQAPKWFQKFISINVAPGIADIQDGWKQFGTITLASDVHFAYDELWQSTQYILYWALGLTLLISLLGSRALKSILSPLDDVVNQAEAIGEHRFISIQEPETLEFKTVVKAMNRLSNRIKQTVFEESARLEALRFEIDFDPVTSLMNHDFFVKKSNASITHEEYFDQGTLVVAKLTNLPTMDEHLGRDVTNQLLKKIGKALQNECIDNAAKFAARINGTDFAVFSSEAKDPQILGNKVRHLLNRLVNAEALMLKPHFITGAIKVNKKDKTNELISMVQNHIAKNRDKPEDILYFVDQEDKDQFKQQSKIAWLPLLIGAIDNKRVKLEHYPVINGKGKLIHWESPVRLQLRKNAPWYCAGEFINWANKLELLPRIDTLVVEAAIEAVKGGKEAIGINLSAKSMLDTEFQQKVIPLIQANKALAGKLYFEIPENGVFSDLAAFKTFAKALKQSGAKVGIEHFGTKLSRLGDLHEIGLDYIKVDVSIIQDIDQNEANKTLLRGICMIAHSIGILAIAEGVRSDKEISALKQIGVDGMTGPGVEL